MTYRIPALVATNSTLVAFASERLASASDESATNIVQRRSTDQGQSWGPLTLVVKSEAGMSSAPWAIADPQTSQVYLFWNANSTADQKCSCGVAMVQGLNGEHYSQPVALPPSSGVLGSSLDSGIVLQKGPHAGRLLVCMRKICKNSCPAPYQAFAAYSDDRGQSWSASPHLHNGTTECQVAELSDGTVYMSIRPCTIVIRSRFACCRLANPKRITVSDIGLPFHGPAGAVRYSATSSSGGSTWTAPKPEPQLVDAGGVDGSVVSDPSGEKLPAGTVYYSHPDAAGRTNMTLYVSTDDAQSWEAAVDVYSGGSAYSSMALIGESKVALLFEEPGDSLAFGILQPEVEMAEVQPDESETKTRQPEANDSPAVASELWTARVQPCVGGANQSWSFAGGALKNAAAGLCVAVPVRSPGCGSTCGRVKLAPCSGAPSQRWAAAAPPSRLVSGADGNCLLIRENPLIDPGILYATTPCKNTSNEWWSHDASSGRLVSLCSSGTCEQWQGWCVTAERGPPVPVPPPPPPRVPDAPLQASELYRTRVHTAGHYCCPGGAGFCNATDEMREQRCSGYYDFVRRRRIFSIWRDSVPLTWTLLS